MLFGVSEGISDVYSVTDDSDAKEELSDERY